MAFQKSILHLGISVPGCFFYKNCSRIIKVLKAAINNAKICKKPIAGYDKEKKRAYVEYANGERKYV